MNIVAPCGFVYVATGERYRSEAATSAAQLRRTNPGARICLIADHGEGPVFWDDLVLLDRPVFGFRDKLAMHLCPYDRFVFLDTDTYVGSDLTEIFQLLDHFDVAGHQLFEGHDYRLADVPDAFPEIQGGVLAFKRSPSVESFFEQWLVNYEAFHALNREGHYHYSNVSEQKTLRLTLYCSSLRLAVLGPEFNFIPAQVDFACATVRIFHGRGDLAAFARRMNAKTGNRVYLPPIDSILSAHTLPTELRHAWWMITLQLLRAATVKCTPLGLRNWLRRSATIRDWFLRNRFAGANAKPDPKWQKPGNR
jgi:hypothetical protein